MANLYRDILNRIPTAAIVLDRNFRVLFANRAFREFFRTDCERGALRKAIGDYLKKQKRVESFRLGKYGEGESGVTIVTLK